MTTIAEADPTTLADWARYATGVSPRDGIYIGGEFRPADSGATFDSVNPATGDVLASVASAQTSDVDAAVRSARGAFDNGDWSRSSVSERKRVLLRLAELVNEHRIELALLDSMDMGKLVSEAFTVDVPSAAGLFAYYGEALDKINGEIAPTEPGNLALITREPLGVWERLHRGTSHLIWRYGRSRRHLPRGTASCSNPPSAHRCPRSD